MDTFIMTGQDILRLVAVLIGFTAGIAIGRGLIRIVISLFGLVAVGAALGLTIYIESLLIASRTEANKETIDFFLSHPVGIAIVTFACGLAATLTMIPLTTAANLKQDLVNQKKEFEKRLNSLDRSLQELREQFERLSPPGSKSLPIKPGQLDEFQTTYNT